MFDNEIFKEKLLQICYEAAAEDEIHNDELVEGEYETRDYCFHFTPTAPDFEWYENLENYYAEEIFNKFSIPEDMLLTRISLDVQDDENIQGQINLLLTIDVYI